MMIYGGSCLESTLRRELSKPCRMYFEAKVGQSSALHAGTIFGGSRSASQLFILMSYFTGIVCAYLQYLHMI